MQYDLVVIGAGPGGYVAAIRAAQLKMKVALIDKRKELGGTCLNVGCIPSKALLQATEEFHRIQTQAAELGILVKESGMDFDKMMQRKEKVVGALVNGVAGLVKKNGVEVIEGEAELVSSTEVKVGDQIIEAKSIILANGSESIELPMLPFDEERVVSSTGALSLKKLPEKLCVIGAGVIGVELASVYARLGSKVTVIELLDQICTPLDLAAAKQLQKSLEKLDVTFHLKTKLTKGEVKDKVHLTAEGVTEEADVVLVAVGRKPNSRGLDSKVELGKRGDVIVDGAFQTSLPNVYAIGDLIDGPMLAHRASEEAVVLVESLAGHRSKIDYMTIPNVIYTHPEVATVGLSEEEAKASNIDPLIGTFHLRANARARTSLAGDGFVKVVGDKKTGRLLGVHIVAPHASEMIGEAVLGIKKRVTVEEIANLPHAHPTLSESLKEAALNALGRTIHS